LFQDRRAGRDAGRANGDSAKDMLKEKQVMEPGDSSERESVVNQNEARWKHQEDKL